MNGAAEPFRGVDAVLASELGARALERALTLGWIDRLTHRNLELRELPHADELTPTGSALLLGQLKSSGVLEGAGSIGLTERFRRVLQARDLLEARLWFLLAIAKDVHEHFPLLLADPGAFVQQAEVFRLFDYSRALTMSPENLAATARWVGYTTALTKYEGPLLSPLLGLEATRRLLDVGGNSGEFALHVAATHPQLRAAVVDLPGVCHLGALNIANRPGAERVAFVPRDIRREHLPGPVDTVVFKSVLHDWPEDMAARFIAAARQVLDPGGRLLIVERAPELPLDQPMPFAMLANLVFLPFFRPAPAYAKLLEAQGFVVDTVRQVVLDMPFQVIAATKPAG
ncbi:MAG TPA: methyltransferase [Devosia sp.]|jgi:SAM-dependent methyltransferase|uniref:methyltransferase n=1 Tax=Devosia sp. TaxID=1871048 RepID=UPI002DDD3F2F|nr:methyltransferase [Devosia sp.]HEV2517580.1 methyltransferase [Devosia sp.]